MYFAGLSWEEGRKLWRKLSRDFHPDLAVNETDRQERTAKFQKLSAEWHVWEWLNDPRTADERREFPTRHLKKQMEYQKMVADEVEQEEPTTARRNAHHEYDFNNRQSRTWQEYYNTFYRGGYGFTGFWNAGFSSSSDSDNTSEWTYEPPPDDWQPSDEEIEEAKRKFADLEWEYTGRANRNQRSRKRPLQFVYDKKLRRLWIHGSTYQIKDELAARGARWDDDHYCNYYQFTYRRTNGSTEESE